MAPNVINKYGIRLVRLDETSIELVRFWRNSPKIRDTMIYRDYITPEMQLRWFRKINNDNNLYYLIENNGDQIGLINIKDISFDKGCGESGVFIYDDNALGKDIAYRAHVCFFDYIFENTSVDFLYAHILATNNAALRFVQFLGYEKNEENSNDDIIYVHLEKEKYLQNKNRLRFIKKWNYLTNKV